jgi:ankyrin repeat protein
MNDWTLRFMRSVQLSGDLFMIAMLFALALQAAGPAVAGPYLPAPKANPALTIAQAKADYFDAARKGRIDVINALLKAGAPINARDERGYTALILAAYNDQPAMVDFLLAHGADACLGDSKGNTAQMGVAYQGYDEISQRLLAAKCDVNQANGEGQTALMMAALFGRTHQIDLLLSKGADPARHDASGHSAAQLAAAQGNAALAAKLSAAQ